MTDLSPAAAAVLDAYIAGLSSKRRDAISAALRAAADQCADGVTHWELYAIAAELEALDD